VIKRERWVVAGVLAVVTVVGSVGVLTTNAHRSARATSDAITTSAKLPSNSAASTTTLPTASGDGGTTVAVTDAKQGNSTKKPGKTAGNVTVQDSPKAKATTKPKAKTSTPVGKATGKVQGTGRIKFGVNYPGVATFYGATGGGSCMFDTTSNLMVTAMNITDYDTANACGDYLKVTGPGGNSITVRVVDSCPECAVGQLDLSAQAFAKLATPSTGRIKISWHLLSPSLSGPVSYQYKSGSSQWWCGIQVRNHRNPVRSLELKVNGSWKNITRLGYNYFISADGSGCGSSIRITDIYGHQLTDTGLKVSPDVIQKGHAQFAGVS
jgi:expansin